MNQFYDRRQFLAGAFFLTLLLSNKSGIASRITLNQKIERHSGSKIKFGLNAYSFNEPLRSGRMTLHDVVAFCASLNFSGLDATGYYFPGYPDVPDDSFVYSLKRKAFLNGITISGTGVKNDFSSPDPERRKNDIQLVKNWIKVAEKLGATVLRIFSGPGIPNGYTRDQVLQWMVPAMKECAEYGKSHGIIIGVQNHNDFLKTAADTNQLVQAVDSEWFGIKLDIGSLRQANPYEEIERLLPFAVSWQLKEHVWSDGKKMPVDLKKIKQLIVDGGYRGFLPIETLGSGDPKAKITNFYSKIRNYF